MSKNETTILEAIRQKCMDCQSCPEACDVKSCPLWHFRNGDNPYRIKRKMSDSQLDNLKKRWRSAEQTAKKEEVTR